MSRNGNTQNGSGAFTSAVITPGRVFYGDGSTVDARPELAADLAAILAGTARAAPECTVVLDGVDLAQLRPDDAAGWQFSTLGAWTTLRRGDRLVALGVRSAMTPRIHHGTLFGADTDPGALALLLDRYQRLTGCAWRGSPAMSALSLMRSTWGNPRKQPLWHAPEIGAGHVGPLIWSRPLNGWEATWGWVHTFDAMGAYLGSAGNAELAWSRVEHTGPRPFDPGRPGYWLIQPAPATLALDGEPGRPPLLGLRGRTDRVCVTTPYARLLAELGDPLHVVDSWTADRGTRVLRGWAQRLRDARVAAERLGAGGMRDALVCAIKRTYTDATGAMARVRLDGGGMLVQRPDWSHTLVDGWRATLYRRAMAVKRTEGVWPVAVKTDALSYADGVGRLDDPDYAGAGNLARAFGIRPSDPPVWRLGGWRHVGAVTAASWAPDRPRDAVRGRARTRPAERHSAVAAVWGVD